MIRILVVGGSTIAYDYIQLLHKIKGVKIVAIIGQNITTPCLQLAKQLNIQIDSKFIPEIHSKANYVVFPNESGDLLQQLRSGEKVNEIFEKVLSHPYNDFMVNEASYLSAIFQVVEDGIIVVNERETIQFINPTASKIIGKEQNACIGKNIKEIIQQSYLPEVLQTQKKQLHNKLQLNNGKQIITSSFPLLNDEHHLIGAFAIFKEESDVIKLAEQNTDLIEIKSMLKAIIHSSDEAISIVDENGIGLIINPAYTKLTGLSEEDIIGQPATVDISEGKSMHLQVLKTRRPVRNVRMKLGPKAKEVTVNVAPIIVAGKLKGSVAVIHDISKEFNLKSELRIAKQIIRNLESTYTFADIIFQSEEMSFIIEQAKLAANSEITVLLKGELGTGKELFANAIHNESDRKYNRFIRVNCLAYDEHTLRKKLFGYELRNEEGMLIKEKAGYFEQASLGTVFLDEIGKLPLSLQNELVTVLKKKKIRRVGSKKDIFVDVRIITSTSKNLEKLVSKGLYNEQLYYHLNKLFISIPSLSERMSDLPYLVNHTIAKVNQLYGRTVKSISEEAMQQLYEYHWPGNVRELENVIRQTIMFMKLTDDTIQTEHLPQMLKKRSNEHLEQDKICSLQEAIEEFEKQYIGEIYKKHKGNKTKTAKALNISVRNLYYKIDKYRLDH